MPTEMTDPRRPGAGSPAMRKLRLVVIAALIVMGTDACGDGNLGDACTAEGKVDGECDDGLVCGKKGDKSSDLVCLEQCNAQAECGAGSECSGLSGTSLKGCRLKR